MQFSKIVAFPLIIALLVILYLIYDRYMESIVLFLVVDVVLLALIFVMAPQIDWLGYKIWTPQLQAPIVELIYKHFPSYRQLSLEDKKVFRDRVTLYMRAHDFQGKGLDSFPEDIKGVLGATAVMYTFSKEKFLLPNYEHIFAYAHPFPSPLYPFQMHNSELHQEDGVLLINIQACMQGLMFPQTTFNVLFHEYAKIYIEHFPDISAALKTNWGELQAISGWPKEYIDKTIGIPQDDPEAVLLNYYFTFPEKTAAALGEERIRSLQAGLS